MRLLPIFFFFSSIIAFGQESESAGFIETRDSSKYIQGYVYYNLQSPNEINFSKYKKGLFRSHYEASDILKFKTNEGSLYLSELVDGKYIFLKHLAGKKKQLLLKEARENDNLIFYVKIDSSLSKLDKESYNEQLGSILEGKKYSVDIANKAKYRIKSLSRVFLYSSSELNYFPKIRIGILLGWSNFDVRLKVNNIVNFKSTPKFTLGAFIETPIEVFSHFAVRFEALFTQNSFSEFTQDGNAKYDYLAIIKSLNLPLILRYRFNLTKNTLFFLEFGPSLTFNKASSNQLIHVTKEPIIINISTLDIPKQMLGGVIGFGSEYSIDFKKDVGLGIRYQYQGSANSVKMNSSVFQIISTINF